MNRRSRKPGGQDVSEGSRWPQPDLDRKFDELVEVAREWDAVAAKPGAVEAMAELSGRPNATAGDMNLLGRVLKGAAEREAQARAEAHALLKHLDEFGLVGLGVYLRANPITYKCLAWLLFEHRRLTRSEIASGAAQSKNAAARAHVADAWTARSDRGQSKASFARMQEHEVRRRFGVSVTADRIARYWIPRD